MHNKFSIALVSTCLITFAAFALADGIDEPIPSYYQEAGPSRTRDYINQHANEKIDPYTGKLQWHYVDLFIPGNGGLDLKVQRSYSSQNEQLGEFSPAGLGWTMHFGRVIRRASVSICTTINPATTNPVLELPDGSRRVLYVSLDNLTFLSTDFWAASCNLSAPGGGLDVFSPDGTVYEMTAQGHSMGSPSNTQNTYYVSKITDRNGNWISFTYAFLPNSIYAVTGATTSDGRSITFTYNGTQLDTVSDGTRTWTYVHSAGPANQTFLRQVLRPGGTSWQYEYNETLGPAGSYSMRRVTYPQGGVIDYTYDFVFFAIGPSIPRSTVITQKVANPGGTWNWTYEPATATLVPQPDGTIVSTIPPPTPEEAARLDKTTVTGPEGTKTFYHVGFNSAFQGIVWLIGWQLGVTDITNQNEAYWPLRALLSSQTNVRPGNTTAFDTETYAPIMRRIIINRNGQNYDTAFSNFDDFANPRTITEQGTGTRITTLTYFTDPVKWIVRGVKKDETLSECTGQPCEGLVLETTRTFDANANLLTETRAGVTTTYTYHPTTGDLASKTDARNKTTSYLNYHRGIPQTENQPESVTVTRVVSNAGNVTSETDGELATTGYSYDGLNRITGITHPIGTPVSVAWTANTRTVTRGAYQEVITYDGFGREASVAHTDTALGETITQLYQVDALGRRTFTSYPNSTNLGTRVTYDIQNRPLTTTHEFNLTTQQGVSSRNNVYAPTEIQTTNERGFLYRYQYRNYGDVNKRELMAINTPPELPAASISMTRNVVGQLKTVAISGFTRSYGYDSRFYLTSIFDPEIGTTEMGRDAVGNMISRKVGGQFNPETTYTYDDRNRMTAITYPAGTPSVTKTYYKDDKPKTISNTTTLWEYFYDANKNLTLEKLTFGPKIFETQYAYNGNDALNVLTYGSGRTVNYAPDAFGRPRQVAPYVTSVAYHPTGMPSSFTYANGVQTTIGLNTRRWPSTLQIAKSGNLFNTTYGYDHLGNVTSIADTVDASYNRTLGYDPLDRLTTVNGPWGGGTIAYNALGDISSQVFGSFNLTYSYSSRLEQVGGSKTYKMSYDMYGNVTGNGTTVFAYNDASNMRCANCGQANEILFDYDGANQRVRLQKGALQTYFVHGHGGQLLWEETPSASVKEYIYLGGKQVATLELPLP